MTEERRIKKREAKKRFERTSKGLVGKIYGHQKNHCKQRGHEQPSYERVELQQWCEAQKIWWEIFERWVASGYETPLKPSLDRVDSALSYTFENLQVMTWKGNYTKGAHERWAKI